MVDSPGGKEVGRLSLKVLPDTSDFDKELRAYAERIEEQVRVELKVHLDMESVSDELTALQARMDAADLDLSIDIDAATAIERLDLTLAAMQATAWANPVEVNVDLDTGAATAQMVATNAALSAGADGSSHMGRQIALWGPLIFAAAAGIAAIGPALAVLFPLVGGLAFGLGAIVLGFDDIKKAMQPVIDAFKGIRDEVGKVLTAGLGPLIATFANDVVPIIREGLVAFADLFNQAATGLLKFLNSGEGLELMADVVKSLSTAFAPFADLLAPLAEVFLRLVVAAAPALEIMGNALLDVTTRFATFLEKGSATDVITESMRDLGHILQVIGSFGADIFPALFAAAPSVIAFLDGLLSSVGLLFQVLQPLFAFMSEHTGTLGILGAILGALAIGIAAVTAATALWNIVLALNPITLIVLAVIALIAGLVYAYQNFETFREIVNAVWAAIKVGVQAAWTAIQAAVQVGVDFVMAHVALIRGVIGIVRDAFNTAKNAVSTAIDGIVDFVKGLPDKAKDALGDLSGVLVDAGKALIQGFLDGIEKMAGKIKNKLGDITSKLTSWKGPESLDKVILRPAGQMVIQGFIDGLDDRIPGVKRTLTTVTDDLASMIDPTSSVDFRNFDSAMSARGSSDDEALVGVIENWETGQMTWRRVARSEVAAFTKLADIDASMGVPQ